MKRSSNQRRAAFTLLEIMTVVIIISLILGVAMNRVGRTMEGAKIVAAKADIDSIKTQLVMYESNVGGLPSTGQGLKALMTKPDGNARNWRKLMDALPVDPFAPSSSDNKDYRYQMPGTHNPDGYDLFSVGPDKIAGNDDDIGNWTNK